MNALPSDVLQFPNAKSKHPPEAIQTLVDILLAMTRVVIQQSDFKKEKSILGEIEYGYPKGPGGPVVSFFKSVRYPSFVGGFDRKTDNSPWYKGGLVIAHQNELHSINVTPAFYEHALGLAFDKSFRRDPPPGYVTPSTNKFYFHAKANPHIHYIFSASLESSNLNEQFPRNFREIEVVNSDLDR